MLIPLFLLLQATPQQPTAPLPPSPVARIEVTPRPREITAGDSVRLTARAVDAQGKPVPNATIRYALRTGWGEATVDSTGMVVASSVGKPIVTITAVVPGTAPVVEKVQIHTVPAAPARIETGVASLKLAVGQTFQLRAVPFSGRNDRSTAAVQWSSSLPAAVRVDSRGFVTAAAPGHAVLTATAGSATAKVPVTVVAALASIAITPASPNVRQGDVVKFAITAKDAAGRAVSGITPTWAFSPGDGQIDAEGNFVAYRPGDYVVTATGGARSASTVVHVTERDVRRPVTVVGRLPRTLFPTSEVWIHPNGNVAYLGTHGGGDRVYAIDISNPASPRVADSIVVNTRLVNDMQTTADGNYMVLTREGAADRKNGIVVADTRDPLHPKQIADFTEGLTAGVHSVYLYETPKFGRYVFATNDGTGSIDIINLDDPAHPRRAGEWKTSRPANARYVHDLDIVDGLLYASYWNDGL
ncbi:MAG TPA: Ig-like domain-containing protein, partial [Gemmatimonadaceae bacterium]|nr:Ig-like domain-containing protein [Gemmatimonadaceae bacterium]